MIMISMMLDYVIVGDFTLEETWRIMEGLIDIGLLRGFGLSIFNRHCLISC